MINTTISHYRILKPLGEGGMGQVYLAEDLNLGRLVAMKMLTAKYNADPDFLARFKREARATAKLNHPNIVMIHEIDEHDGITYIVMEYVEGESLKDLIRREKLPIPKILDLVRQVCDGLGAAHMERVVHRDIKPANILLSKTGQVKIVDFGIAKLQDTAGLTQKGTTMGTPHYMAPEQVKGETVDTRADIFSVGVLFWEMLARQLPFNGDTYAIMYAITQKEPAPLAKFNPDVSPNLQKIIDRCLQKDVDQRYQNVEELRIDLLAEKRVLLGGDQKTEALLPHTEPDFKKIRPDRWRRRAMMALVVPALIAVIYLLIRRPGTPPVIMAGLSIATNPAGAAVFLNGDSIGMTPLDNFSVAAEEELAVLLRKPDYFTFDTVIVVKKSARFRLSQSLRPAAQVAVIVNPATAQVVLDGQTISPSRLADLQLEVGQHRISVLSAGYEPVEERFVLRQGFNPPRRYNLVKLTNVAPPNTGGLFITSQPAGAKLTLNGAPAGSTPYQNQTLKPGRYAVVASKEGFENYSGEATVRAGEIAPLEVTLKALTVTGRLNIKSDPEGATIFLDGRDLGATPNDLNNIAAGSHQITLRKKGYKDYATTVTVAPQQLQTVEALLEMLIGTLQVLVKPFGSIYVDDELKKTNADVRVTINLAARSHKLRVTHPTYGNYEKDVIIDAEATLDVVVDFNRVLTIQVTADGAEWGNIFVDGESKGQTPKDLRLRLGLHTIEVRRDGYISLDRPMTINLEENWKQPLKFRLQKKE